MARTFKRDNRGRFATVQAAASSRRQSKAERKIDGDLEKVEARARYDKLVRAVNEARTALQQHDLAGKLAVTDGQQLAWQRKNAQLRRRLLKAQTRLTDF